MTARTFTVDQLVISPFNVRTCMEDAEATAALEDSIAARGLIEQLVVHPMDRAQTMFGVLAGGRRFRAIRRLIESGRKPADFPIAVQLLDLYPDTDAAAIVELSTAENLLRRDLRPYEVHAAVSRARAEGAKVEEIAAALGQREDWVRQQLRLGDLDPLIFAAYTARRIDIDLARAYAATEDRALQRAAWAHFAGPSQNHTAAAVRRFMKVGDWQLDRLLAYVGPEAYSAAGGRFELDLFYDRDDGTQRGRVIDEGKLRELAEIKLEQVRADVRDRSGFSTLRFATQGPQREGSTDHTLAFDVIEDENGTIELPAAATADNVVAVLAIGDDARPFVRWYWASRKAKAAAFKRTEPAEPNIPAHPEEDAPSPSRGYVSKDDINGARDARAAVKAEHGLTGDGLHVARSLRRELLRAVLVIAASEDETTFNPASKTTNRATLARDYLIWSQLRQEFTGANGRTDRGYMTGARGLTNPWTSQEDSGDPDLIAPHLAESQANTVWTEALAWLRAEPFMLQPEPADSLEQYVALDDDNKNLAAAILAGSALLRSANTDGWRIAAHDRLAQLAGINDATLRALWTPTPAFMGLLPKMKRLELAQPFIAPDVLAGWTKLDDRTLTAATAAAFLPEAHSDPAIAEAAGSWVHELLRFKSTNVVTPNPVGAEPVEAPPFLELPRLRQPEPVE